MSDIHMHYLGDFLNESHYNACVDAGFIMQCNLDTIPKGDLILPRFTIQDYNYKEYISNLTDYNSHLDINQYEFCSDIRNWYPVLRDYTFPTYFTRENLPEQRYVVRGCVRGDKLNWNTKMFAPDKQSALAMASPDDIFRQYIELKAHGLHDCGIPISNEYRLFVYYGEIIYGKFYWGNLAPQSKTVTQLFKTDPEFMRIQCEAIYLVVKQGIRLFTIDLAQDTNDRWWVVEINDGTRSGIPITKPEDYSWFYKKLYGAIKNGSTRR